MPRSAGRVGRLLDRAPLPPGKYLNGRRERAFDCVVREGGEVGSICGLVSASNPPSRVLITRPKLTAFSPTATNQQPPDCSVLTRASAWQVDRGCGAAGRAGGGGAWKKKREDVKTAAATCLLSARRHRPCTCAVGRVSWSTQAVGLPRRAMSSAASGRGCHPSEKNGENTV